MEHCTHISLSKRMDHVNHLVILVALNYLSMTTLNQWSHQSAIVVIASIGRLESLIEQTQIIQQCCHETSKRH